MKKVKKGNRIYYIIGGVLVLLTILALILMNTEKSTCCLHEPNEEELAGFTEVQKDTNQVSEENLEGQSVENVDFQLYNYEFAEDDVKEKLDRIIGNKKTAFYLPPTGYVNVSRGEKFGIAYALNNVNPSGRNFFDLNWTVDSSITESCKVSEDVGNDWIEKNWYTSGIIPEGWIDHMTIYFHFPNDSPKCNVKYNFIISKDGKFYDSKQVEFNIV